VCDFFPLLFLCVLKHVKVTIDYIRPKEGGLDERECATVRYASHNA